MDNNPFDDFDARRIQQQPIPLAAPRPGYAAPVAALNLARPSPAATPEGRMPASPSMSEYPKPLTLVSQQASLPNTPHPLHPPMTPISPAFARPSKRDVKFSTQQPILRGEKEETLLPKRGQQGDDFWRRFSMVAKEESKGQRYDCIACSLVLMLIYVSYVAVPGCARLKTARLVCLVGCGSLA